MSRHVKDEAGNTYKRLRVLSRYPSAKPYAIWLCQCECGAVVAVPGKDLRSGRTVSCGCWRAEQCRIMSKSTWAKRKESK